MNNKYFTTFFVFILLLLSGCFAKQDLPKEWNSIFTKNQVNGTFVLYNTNSKEFKYFNRKRADSTFIPASTFKILNSLIALENEVVVDENELIKWDGIERNYKPWNRDQTMKSAISISCVWFYQELARRIGLDKMQSTLDEVGYGNKMIGSNIDDFWLVGDLKISAMEQIHFLDRLIQNKLPFEIKNQEITKLIMVTDSSEHYIIHSKTGWGVKKTPNIGWIVGYVEKANNKWIFALNIDINKRSELAFRKKILYDILESENIIE